MKSDGCLRAPAERPPVDVSLRRCPRSVRMPWLGSRASKRVPRFGILEGRPLGDPARLHHVGASVVMVPSCAATLSSWRCASPRPAASPTWNGEASSTQHVARYCPRRRHSGDRAAAHWSGRGATRGRPAASPSPDGWRRHSYDPLRFGLQLVVFVPSRLRGSLGPPAPQPTPPVRRHRPRHGLNRRITTSPPTISAKTRSVLKR